MIASPQLLYIILVLPVLFGITVMGEGISRVAKNDYTGIVSIVFGFGFIGIAIVAYFFFTTYLNRQISL